MKEFKYCFVYITVENFKQAEIIAELAIKKKLCACANIFLKYTKCLNGKEKLI
jgi:uncharacterized protein involved in tolerance to divalent cations